MRAGAVRSGRVVSPRPLHQLTEPLTASSDGALRDLHPERVNRNPGVRLLVRIDSDRHHLICPFVD